jgi:hypothetical protein
MVAIPATKLAAMDFLVTVPSCSLQLSGAKVSFASLRRQSLMCSYSKFVKLVSEVIGSARTNENRARVFRRTRFVGNFFAGSKKIIGGSDRPLR